MGISKPKSRKPLTEEEFTSGAAHIHSKPEKSSDQFELKRTSVSLRAKELKYIDSIVDQCKQSGSPSVSRSSVVEFALLHIQSLKDDVVVEMLRDRKKY